MTNQQILKLLKTYATKLQSLGYTPVESDHTLYLDPFAPESQTISFNNILDMLPKINEFLSSGDPEKVRKADRWLGFVQGVLWRNGENNLLELRNHNRS
jgi:hypothetical protein